MKSTEHQVIVNELRKREDWLEMTPEDIAEEVKNLQALHSVCMYCGYYKLTVEVRVPGIFKHRLCGDCIPKVSFDG